MLGFQGTLGNRERLDVVVNFRAVPSPVQGSQGFRRMPFSEGRLLPRKPPSFFFHSQTALSYMYDQKPREIRVVKRKDIPRASAILKPITSRDISSAVDNWIVERSYSRDADRISSNLTITRWRALPDTQDTE